MFRTFIITLLVIAYPMRDSFMGVECFPEKGMIKAFVKMNYNDFVFDYRFTINDDQHFDPSGKIDTTQILVSKYLENRIQIFADEKLLKGQITGIESADGELRLDFIYSYNKRSKLFKIKNLMLTEYKESHSNHLIFKYKDFEEGVTLTRKKTDQSFKVK